MKTGSQLIKEENSSRMTHTDYKDGSASIMNNGTMGGCVTSTCICLI